MNEHIQELINLCNNLQIDLEETETDVVITIGNLDITVDKKTGNTDNENYPFAENLIREIEEW